MSNKLLPLAALLLLLPAGVSRSAAVDLAPWSRVAPVDLKTAPAKGLVEVELPPEVLAAARPDLADLRLFAANDSPVPYVLRHDRGLPDRSVSYPATRLFNPVFLPGKQSTVTVDFGSRAPRSRIDIDTPGANFRRRVTVEAGQDGQSFQVLKASDWLFRINYENGTYNKSQILLPDNDFRYLRLTVFNAPDDPEQVPIQHVTAWELKGGTVTSTAEVPAKTAVTQDEKLKTTDIDADLGYENLPVAELSLAFTDPNFLRRVEVFGRNVRTRTILEPVENSQPRRREIDEPWTSLAVASVYRLAGGQGQDPSTGLTLNINGQCRYLLIRIFNGDDAPLHFSALMVRRFRDYVDFQPTDPGPWRLYLGNDAAAQPHYDLETFAGRLRSDGVTPAALGTLAPNPLFAAPPTVIPWSERHAALLWTGLVVVLGILTLLVARQARRARALARGRSKDA